MKLSRRQFLHLASGVAALPAVSPIARAQTYPTRPVRIMSGFPAGGGTDIVARLIGQRLSERLGQQFIIETRVGAGGNIATESVVHAPPDGYTVLFGGSNDAINATLYTNLKFNFIRDIAPVAGLIRLPNVMVLQPSFPAKTVSEFITFAKANPGKVNIAFPGNGTPQHIAVELFEMMAGVNMAQVLYRGGSPALTDLLGGQIQVVVVTLAAAIEYIRAGTLRGLAVTSTTRFPALPDIPTVGEYVPGFESSTWFSVGAPKKTPAEIIGAPR
jgi:tripartite-type tricarboxylate transporter receptor subunit TctC